MRKELEAIVGAAALDERAVRDLWPLGLMQERDGAERPRVLVARPAGREQVIAILRWAGANAVAVTPMGGASGVCGALAPRAGELVLDMGGFDRILALDEVNLTCTCESGVNGMELEKQLNERGLTLGHFPSSLPGTTVGGLIATRSSGQESSRYGSIEDMVLSLAVVLPDGTFAAPRPGPRSAVGPALHQLWLGAEGALGVVLGAVLRIHRLPASVIGRGYSFRGLTDGLEAMRLVMQSGVRPLVMRLYDHEDSVFSRFEVSDGECVMVIATAGEEEVARAEAGVVRRLTAGAKDLGDEPWRRWQERRFALSAEWLKGILQPAGSYVDTIELAAPWTVLPQLHERVKTAIAVGGLALCHFSHAYEQGCCAYFSFAGAAGSGEEARAGYSRAWEGAMSAGLELGATISHHHGTGQALARWVVAEMGGWLRVWRSAREGLDPPGSMNPNAMGGRRHGDG